MASLQTMTLEQAGDLIVSRLHGNVKYAEKPAPAAAASPTGETGAAPPNINPMYAALLGGGLGAGAGALGSLTSSDKEKRKRWLKNMLLGGAAGGIGGGALGAMFKGTQELIPQTEREIAAAGDKGDPSIVDNISRVTKAWADFLGWGGGKGGAGDGGKGGPNNAGPSLAGKLTGAVTGANPVAVGLGSAAAGGAFDNYLSRRAHSNHINREIQHALNNEKPGVATAARAAAPGVAAVEASSGSPILDKINATLRAGNMPEITPAQVSAVKTPRSMLGYANEAHQRNVASGAATMKQRFNDFMTGTNPINRPKPMGPPRPAPESLVQPRLSSGQQQVAHSSIAGTTAPPAKRWGAKGSGLGLAAGTILSLMGDPNKTQKEKALEAATPLSMQ